MQRVRRFVQLSGAERGLLLQAFLGIIYVRFLLHMLPLRRVQHFISRSSWHSESTCTPERMLWAIRAAARFVPRSTCLIQALVAQALLNRFGYKSLLTIGVAKNDRGRLEAHAWVSCEGQLLIGGPRVERYNPLLNLGSVS